MEVISVNIGQKKTIIYNGESIETGIYKYPVDEAIDIGFTDVAGDDVIDRRYHGGLDKACYLYSADHYRYWKLIYPDLDWQWGMFGENLTVNNLHENKIHIGDIFEIGSTTVQVTQPRQPCFKLGIRLNNPKAVKQFVQKELPGVYFRVLKNGEISKGDQMILVDQKVHNFTITEVFHLIYNAQDNIDKVKQAIGMPELADSCRADLMKYSKLKNSK